MKASIILKPKNAGIENILLSAGFYHISYNEFIENSLSYFMAITKKNIYIDRVPEDELYSLYEEIRDTKEENIMNKINSVKRVFILSSSIVNNYKNYEQK